MAEELYEIDFFFLDLKYQAFLLEEEVFLGKTQSKDRYYHTQIRL